MEFLVIVVLRFLIFWQMRWLQLSFFVIFGMVCLCVMSLWCEGMLILQMCGWCMGGVVEVKVIEVVLVFCVIWMIFFEVVLCMIELLISSMFLFWNFVDMVLSFWCMFFLCIVCFGMMKVWLMQWFLQKFLWYLMLSLWVIFMVVGWDEFGIGMIMLILFIGMCFVIVFVSLLFICRCDLQIEMLFIMELGWVRQMYLNVYGVRCVFVVYCLVNSLLLFVMNMVLLGLILWMILQLLFFSMSDLFVMIYLLCFFVLGIVEGW